MNNVKNVNEQVVYIKMEVPETRHQKNTDEDSIDLEDQVHIQLENQSVFIRICSFIDFIVYVSYCSSLWDTNERQAVYYLICCTFSLVGYIGAIRYSLGQMIMYMLFLCVYFVCRVYQISILYIEYWNDHEEKSIIAILPYHCFVLFIQFVVMYINYSFIQSLRLIQDS